MGYFNTLSFDWKSGFPLRICQQFSKLNGYAVRTRHVHGFLDLHQAMRLLTITTCLAFTKGWPEICGRPGQFFTSSNRYHLKSIGLGEDWRRALRAHVKIVHILQRNSCTRGKSEFTSNIFTIILVTS
jgi:hypothetical protein